MTPSEEKEIPFVAYGNDELVEKPDAGDFADCPNCKKQHKIKFGTTDGKENKFLGYISCGKKSYLASLAGKLL